MIGAGMGLQTVMDELAGGVVLFAVPAEEYVEIEYRIDLASRARSSFSPARRS